MNATLDAQVNVDFDYLSQELQKTEGRFNLTKREFKGNKLVRKAQSRGAANKAEGLLMGEVALDGLWYTNVKIGEPTQEIEMDLNMLASDCYILTTNSHHGSRFDDLFSQTYEKSTQRPYPGCTLPSEIFHLPTIKVAQALEFTHCRPSKASLFALGASGSTLGLAPSDQLSQTGSTSILKQLVDKGLIQRTIFSLMLINGHEGVLSIGGTAVKAIEMVVAQTELELDKIGALERGEALPTISSSSLEKRAHQSKDTTSGVKGWLDEWAWSKVQGAEGWWQILMQGVFVDGVKVVQNQAVVIDINSPFILAPPLAAKAFYASVSGSYPLQPPYSNFYAFPCLNPPVVQFEFAGSKFPFMQGGRGADWTGFPGGKFSLGRLEAGSGYCVGAVVETRMGLREEPVDILDGGKRGFRASKNKGTIGGSGMKDVWVIGEGFFRGVGGVFDFEEARVGFRTY